MTGVNHHAQVFPLNWDHELFLPRLVWNQDASDFSLPHSWMTTTHHHTQLLVEMRMGMGAGLKP
jgi:hypothetical protein